MQALRTGFAQASLAVAEAPASQCLVPEAYWDNFTLLGLMCFGTLPMGGVGFPKLALVNFGGLGRGLGRDCGCQFDRTGCAYAA